MTIRAAIVLFLALAGGGAFSGCVTEGRLRDREDELMQEWRKAHPGEVMPEAERERIHKEAGEDVAREAEGQREEAITKAAETGSAFSRGNILGGIFGLIGLAGLGFSAFRGRKKGAV